MNIQIHLSQNKMKHCVLAIAVLTLMMSTFSCKPMVSVGKKQILDFGAFTIECPSYWKKINKTGIDSYVGEIEIGSKEILEFDLGWYSFNLIEDAQTISWDSIDGRRAKIVTPITGNIGLTGIYFDSLWTNGSEKTKLNLYGTNLTTKNRLIFMDAIKTLKFYEPK
jgi:hypothetical protein